MAVNKSNIGREVHSYISTVIGSFYLPSGTPHYPISPSFPLASGPTCPNTISIITAMSTIRKALEVGTPQTDECSFSYSYNTENRPDPLPGLDIWRMLVVARRVCECPSPDLGKYQQPSHPMHLVPSQSVFCGTAISCSSL